MPVPAMALMTITAGEVSPSIAEAAALLGVASADLNPDFGVVPIDRSLGTYVVEVRADRLPQEPTGTAPYRGPFSNPRIEPMSPPMSPSSGDKDPDSKS